jgi:hypothetical protein
MGSFVVPPRARWGLWRRGRTQLGSPARIREWAAQELTTGRLLPWFAVAYGTGVVFYFTAEREPALWAAAVPTSVFALGAVLLRRQIVPHVIALGLFGIALALCRRDAQDRADPASGAALSGCGFIELREESQHTDRFMLRVDRIDGGRRFPPPWLLGAGGFCFNQSMCRHLFALRVGPLVHRRDGPMLALTFRAPVCPPGATHSPRASGTPQRTLDIRQRFSLQVMMSRKNDWRNPNKI